VRHCLVAAGPVFCWPMPCITSWTPHTFSQIWWNRVRCLWLNCLSPARSHFMQGFRIHSDLTIRTLFIFETGVPVIESLELVLRCKIWDDTFALHFTYFLHHFCCSEVLFRVVT
jgi:hypothetical protein